MSALLLGAALLAFFLVAVAVIRRLDKTSRKDPRP